LNTYGKISVDVITNVENSSARPSCQIDQLVEVALFAKSEKINYADPSQQKSITYTLPHNRPEKHNSFRFDSKTEKLKIAVRILTGFLVTK
jgi:hypothetical protein